MGERLTIESDLERGSLLRRRLPAGVLLFALALSVYALTLTESHLGYEGETIAQARGAWKRLTGASQTQVFGRAGLLDVAFYLPFVAVDEWIQARGAFVSFHNFTPNFALPLVMALAALVVYVTSRELWSWRPALAVAATFAFGTMAWPYAKLGMESTLTLATAVAVWGLIREIRAPGRSGYLLMALGAGAMLLTKVQAPLVVVLLAATVGWLLLRRSLPRLPSPGVGLAALLVFAAFVAAFLWGNQWRYGRWLLPTSYGFTAEVEPPRDYFWNLAGFFISPGKSLFAFNPPLLLAAALAPTFIARRHWFGGALTFFVLPQIIFHAYFRTWADEVWGPRRLMNLLPILVLPIGVLFEPGPWPRWVKRPALALAFGLGVVMQLLAASMNYASYSWALRPSGSASQENLVWNPQTTQYGFQARLLQSAVERWRTGRSLQFVIEPEYLDWNRPDEPPATTAIDLSPFDASLDFWWSQRAARDPRWMRFDNKSLYLLSALVTITLGALTCILIDLARPDESDDARSI
jgi:hypothetical protein